MSLYYNIFFVYAIILNEELELFTVIFIFYRYNMEIYHKYTGRVFHLETATIEPIPLENGLFCFPVYRKSIAPLNSDKCAHSLGEWAHFCR